MNKDLPWGRLRPMRIVALAWIVVALNIAGLQAYQVASALTAGQTRIPVPPAALLQVSRATEPVLFHTILVASMLLALVCLYSIQRAWHVFRMPRSVACAQRKPPCRNFSQENQ